MSELTWIFSFIIGFVIIFTLFYIVSYVFRGFGLYNLAKNNGYEDIAYLSFIPIANIYVLGELIEGSIGEKNDHIEAYAGLGLFTANFISGGIMSLFYSVYYLYMNHKLFYRLGKNAWVHTVINIVTLGFWFYISVFIFRNDKLYDLIPEIEEEDTVIDLKKLI